MRRTSIGSGMAAGLLLQYLYAHSLKLNVKIIIIHPKCLSNSLKVFNRSPPNMFKEGRAH